MNKQTLTIIILSVVLGLSLWFGINRHLTLKDANKSIEVLNEQSIELEKRNNILIDSITSNIETRSKERVSLERKIDSLNNLPKRPYYDKNIDTTNDPDKLDSLFARYYGNN